LKAAAATLVASSPTEARVVRMLLPSLIVDLPICRRDAPGVELTPDNPRAHSVLSAGTVSKPSVLFLHRNDWQA
jgi:hypothetical protein